MALGCQSAGVKSALVKVTESPQPLFQFRLLTSREGQRGWDGIVDPCLEWEGMLLQVLG